jgi:hypothetical protein
VCPPFQVVGGEETLIHVIHPYGAVQDGYRLVVKKPVRISCFLTLDGILRIPIAWRPCPVNGGGISVIELAEGNPTPDGFVRLKSTNLR